MQMTGQMFQCGDGGCETGGMLSAEEADKLSQATSPVLREAIAEELKSILARGVSISMLMELSRFSHTAQELLMIRSPLAEVRRKRAHNYQSNGPNMYSPSMLGSYGAPGGFAMSPYQSEYGYGEDAADVGSLTQEAAQNETFGAKMTREIVSALGAMKRNTGPSVQGLIESIKQARDAGLDDVVAKLQASLDDALGGEKEPEAPRRPRRPEAPAALPVPPTVAVAPATPPAGVLVAQ